MNQDEFDGKWKQLRGETRAWWGKLTDDDVEKVGGKFEKLVGVISDGDLRRFVFQRTP